MRAITNNAINAFINNQSFSEGNTVVSPSNGNNYLYLFGHIIAIKNKDTGDIKITNAGYFTATTKERLNALPNVNISQRKGVWYLNGKEWDGKLIEI